VLLPGNDHLAKTCLDKSRRAGSTEATQTETVNKREGLEMNANEATVRNAYQVAERKDLAGWVNCFTEDGTFTDESIGVTYRDKQLSQPVEIYAAAFPDMHRELYRFLSTEIRSLSSWHYRERRKGHLNRHWGSYRRRANGWMHRVATCFA
jgi:hypothetical protein